MSADPSYDHVRLANHILAAVGERWTGAADSIHTADIPTLVQLALAHSILGMAERAQAQTPPPLDTIADVLVAMDDTLRNGVIKTRQVHP